MSEAANNLIFAGFAISTAICMKRGGYAWLPAVLTGLLSPVVYLILFAILLLPIQIAIGKLGISEQQLSNRTVEIVVSLAIVVAWIAGGLFLTRRKTKPMASSTEPTTS